MSSEIPEVRIDIQNIPPNNAIPASSKSSINLENPAIISSLLPYLTAQDIDHLSRTNRCLLNTVLSCNDWEKCVSTLFYPIGFSKEKHKKSMELINEQITDYQKQKNHAVQTYNALQKYQPLFKKYKQLSDRLLLVCQCLLVACVFFLIAHIFEVSFAMDSEKYLSTVYIPIYLIIHLVCLYAFVFLSYYISSVISIDFEKDVFFYHLGVALHFPLYMHYCMPVYDHVFFTILAYTFSHAIWYFSFLGYLVFSTESLLYSVAALLYMFCTYKYRVYLTNKAKRPGSNHLLWKVYLTSSEDYFMICYSLSVVVALVCFIHSIYFGNGGLFYIVYPFLLIIYFLYKLLQVSQFTEILLLFVLCLPFIAYPVLMYLCYTIQINMWSWLASVICIVLLIIWGFLVVWCYQRKRLFHYISICVNEVSEASIIKEYCNNLGFEQGEDIDYSSTNEFLFKIALERAISKRDGNTENQSDENSASGSDFTPSSENESSSSESQSTASESEREEGRHRQSSSPSIQQESERGSDDWLNSREFVAFQMAMLMSLQNMSVNQRAETNDGPVIEEVVDNGDGIFSVD